MVFCIWRSTKNIISGMRILDVFTGPFLILAKHTISTNSDVKICKVEDPK